MIQNRLYFAYGCNLSPAEMKRKCPHAQILGIAKLPKHRLNFYGYSPVWDGATESVISNLESDVWGVLYKLGAGEWDMLDSLEDARFDGTGAYFHYPVEVIDTSQKVIEATIYKKAELREPQLPSSEYIALIVKGAKAQGLPNDYIEFLEKRATKPATYAVPREPKGRHLLVSGDCSGCS